MNRPFADRMEAGRVLAKLLATYAGRTRRDRAGLAAWRCSRGVRSGLRALRRRWMCSWCGSWCCPVRKSWRWARSPRATSWS